MLLGNKIKELRDEQGVLQRQLNYAMARNRLCCLPWQEIGEFSLGGLVSSHHME